MIINGPKEVLVVDPREPLKVFREPREPSRVLGILRGLKGIFAVLSSRLFLLLLKLFNLFFFKNLSAVVSGVVTLKMPIDNTYEGSFEAFNLSGGQYKKIFGYTLGMSNSKKLNDDDLIQKNYLRSSL